MYIANCVQLPDNWTVENLLSKHASKPYNHNIANVFYLAGFIESWGTVSYTHLDVYKRQVHRHTAAELIVERADAKKEHMGLTTWEAAPDGKIVKADVSIVKNYLSDKEMSYMERIVSLYLDYAELQAERQIPMSMEDWAKRLDGFLEFNGNEILTDAGKISAEQAKLYAETEFENHRIVQDRIFVSDYDKFLLEVEENAKE